MMGGKKETESWRDGGNGGGQAEYQTLTHLARLEMSNTVLRFIRFI